MDHADTFRVQHGLRDALEPVAVSLINHSPNITREEIHSLSSAISLKRIADALSEGGSAFLAHLGGVLSDASHDHAQRMR